jgi:glycosyltransferase involved in cell wall biosynthesis
MIAAWIARVPVRIYVLRGLRFETKHGLMRMLLVFVERITSALAHHVICVSPSLKEKYCALGIVSRSKTLVLNEGSSNGIDITRFSMRSDSVDRQTLLNLFPNSQLIGFIGRLTHDKGILDLLDAFEILLPSFPNLHLLLVGDVEKGDPLPADCVKRINEHQRIVKKPFLNDPVPYYRVIDMLVFPSHREGFPNAPIEAAALGIPTVGFLATGTMDAVKNGITGTLVPIGDTPALAKAVAYYLQNSEIRKRHGEAACARVHAQFRQEQIWQALQDTYMELVRCRTNKIENVDYQLNGSQKNF